MSKLSTIGQVFLNDGTGKSVPIATGAWLSQAINIEEKRRLSVTVGILGTGALPLTTTNGGNTGGFTGVLQIQSTNELAQSYGMTGTPQANVGPQPGINGLTGALFWNTLAGGQVNITQQITSLQLDFTDIGANWIRFVFNQGTNAATGTLGGSGVMQIFYTAKHT